MADIDQIIAGGAGASSRADFSGIPKLLDSYWAGLDQRAKNDLRDAFKPTAENPNGVPMKDGQIDIPTVAKTLFQKGDIAGGAGLLGQATNVAERAAYAGGPPPPQGPQSALTPVDAPSPSRTVQGRVAPELNKGGVQAQGDGGETPKSYLGKLGLQPGYNMEVGLAAFKRNGIEPDQPFNPNDPNLAKVMPAMQRLGGIGQVQPPQPGDGQPMAPQQQAPQVAQAQPQGFQPSPAQAAAQNDPQLKRLRFMAASPDKSVAESARAELKSYIESKQPTTEMRNASAPGLLERQGEQAAQQAGAIEAAKGYVTKYNNIDEAGTKAIQEIPKLEMARKLMDSPDFQSGSGQRFDLAYRRLAVRLGGDPDKAAPQEIVSKVVADSILNGLGSLKGLGPIRVAEMNLARTAAMSMDNTPQTNRFLADVSIRIQKRAVEVSDMAQNYNDGVLDVGFDKKLREMDKKNPLFTPEEVQRFQKIIGGEEKQPKQPASQQASQQANTQQFSSPGDVHAAIASGKLKSGDAFKTSDGRTKYVP